MNHLKIVFFLIWLPYAVFAGGAYGAVVILVTVITNEHRACSIQKEPKLSSFFFGVTTVVRLL